MVFENKAKIILVFKDPDYMDVEGLILHNPVLFYRLHPC